jgi:hypothetical protein
MLPVRYEIAAIGVGRMTKAIPRIQFQQRDIAKSFLGIENRGRRPERTWSLRRMTGARQGSAFAGRLVL